MSRFPRLSRTHQVLAALSMAAWASSAFAANYNYDLTSFAAFGTTNQNAPGIVNGRNACGPTSTINSLQYLQNRMGVTGLVTNPSTNINSLGVMMGLPQGTSGGVFDQNMVNGKAQYIHNWNVNHTDNQIHIEAMGDNLTGSSSSEVEVTGNTAPTLDFIRQQIAAGQDVEIGFNWTNSTGNGGHWVTLTGLSGNDNSSTNATAMILDPFGPTTGTGSAVATTATITAGSVGSAIGHLLITYNGGGANNGADPDNTQVVGFGWIDSVVAESPVKAFPVPEPTSLALVVAAGATLLLRRRGKSLDVQFTPSKGEILAADGQ